MNAETRTELKSLIDERIRELSVDAPREVSAATVERKVRQSFEARKAALRIEELTRENRDLRRRNRHLTEQRDRLQLKIAAMRADQRGMVQKIRWLETTMARVHAGRKVAA